MSKIINFIKELDIGILDIVDIFLVTVVFYWLFNFLRKRRADKLLIGIIFLVIIDFACVKLDLSAMSFLLSKVLEVGAIAIFIIFQPEIRTALEKVGGEPIKNIKNITKSSNDYSKMLDQICASVADMSAGKIGSLIVIERTMKNDDLYSNGTVLDSEISRNLLNTIFFKLTALHDGAVVIRDFRIYAAACCLPLSTIENGQEAAHTRHLAALGTSERCDALVIVTSEESGKISLAHDGEFEKFANAQALKARLSEILVGSSSNDRKNGREKRSKKDGKNQ